MKTSNKIFIATGLLLLAYMVGYDFTLKSAYEKGDYKSRFYNMTELKFNNFNIVNHQAGNMLGLRVEHGDKYGVWVDKNLKDWVKITQNGQVLNITYAGKNFRQAGSYQGIVIICPVLSQVTATPFPKPKDVEEYNFGSDGGIEVAGFKQTLPMNIRSDKSISVTLSKNTLTDLTANIGNSPKERPRLTIEQSNHIATAHITMQGASQLSLYGPAVEKPDYHLGDSTMVTLSGSALKLVQPKL